MVAADPPTIMISVVSGRKQHPDGLGGESAVSAPSVFFLLFPLPFSSFLSSFPLFPQ